MDEKSFHIRVPKKGARIALVVTVTALIVAPLTAIASHSFTDVPDSNIFHNDIEWLKDSGVTRGCNPPSNTEFCPKDSVTREAMAAFMRRFAQYIDAEDGTPAQADNADTLEGSTKAQLAPRAAFNSTGDAPNGANLTLSATIIAPAKGILTMSGGVDASAPAGNPDQYVCFLQIDNGLVPGSQMVSHIGDTTATASENCTTTGAAVVDAGTHVVDFEVIGVNAETNLVDASVWATWIPFDGTGAVPTSITELGQSDLDIDPDE